MTTSSPVYPFTTPEPGHFLEVAPGVHWIRLPMPYRLDHINVWALEDGDGWALVDTGTRTEDVVQAWERLLALPPFDRPLTRVLITHMHPDHIGMAGALTRRFGVRMWMSREEYLGCRTLMSDTGREAPPDALRFYEEAGWGPAAMASYRSRFGNFGRSIHAPPDSYKRLQEGQVIEIGGRRWEVVIGSGHSPEHACLYDAEGKLLISGDQVLPRISSNVSVHPTEPDANPMADWLSSLDKLQARIPDDVLVLPSHNDCFFGLHARLEHMRQSQHAALDRLRELLAQPQRAVDCFVALFKRPIEQTDALQLQLATGETLSCLNYLMQRAEVDRSVRDGVAWYRLV